MTSNRHRVRARVRGRVQGVCYRAHTQEKARNLGLVGWVRNLPDGDVEFLAEGERGALEDFIKICRQGPPAAKVSDLVLEWEVAQQDLEGFEIRY